jgi:hypothetical protein
LLEQPDIEATRIVWEHELEGTAIELMNAAEGETAKAQRSARSATKWPNARARRPELYAPEQ